MCYCLDLRSDSKLAKFVSNKLIAALVAVIQLIIWVASLFTMIAPPASVKAQLQSSAAGEIAFAVIFILAGIGFSVLLLIGILKNNWFFVNVFLILNVAVIVIFIISIIYNICTQPARFGLSGFLSSSLHILLDVLTYFIIRNYYLAGTSRPANQAQINNPKRVGA